MTQRDIVQKFPKLLSGLSTDGRQPASAGTSISIRRGWKKSDSVGQIQDTGSDNPPVGILLCTRKGKKMVEYALAGMDNRLFVTTYMLQLPDRKTLEEFLLQQLPE